MQNDLLKNGIIVGVIFLIMLNILIPSCISNKSFCQDYLNCDNGSYKMLFKTSYNDNNPPIVRNQIPENNTVVDISLSKLSVYLEDYKGDRIDWSIETSPDIGMNSGFGETNGTKSCNINGLQYSKTYYWYVNATDPFGSNIYTKKVYVFTTEEGSGYVPTVSKITIEVAPRNRLAINLVGIEDDIMDWADKINKVRVEWTVKNPQHFSYNNPNPIINFRIREWQIYNNFPGFTYFFTESGRIDTPEGDWIEIQIPIRNETYSGNRLIDVELLTKEDMIMVTAFFCYGRYLQGIFLYEKSTHYIYFY